MQNYFRNSLKKKVLLKYLIITFILTWCVWGILILSTKGIISNTIHSRHTFLYIIVGGSAPSFVAFLYTGLTNGLRGIKDLFKKILIWKVNPLWYLFVLLYIPVIYYLPVVFCQLLGEQYIITQRFEFQKLITLFIGQLYVGPINEEFGWRGFVLPRLQDHHHPMVSSILLGGIHAIWHIPLYFITGIYQFKTPFLLYLLTVISFSIIYTWLYNGTGGSLIFVCLLHASYNFQPNYFKVIVPANPSIIYTVLSNIFAFVPFIIIVFFMLRPKYQKKSVSNKTSIN